MSFMEAISGLFANNDCINIISHNIANASTIGYKSRQPVFLNLCSHSFNSNIVKGSGVSISDIIQNFSNGPLIETDRDLDLGITNNGFFRVLDSKGHVHYTRNGQFLLDKDKNIINMQGMYLTGKNKYYSSVESSVEPINLQHAYELKAKPTSSITISAILNSNINSINNIDDINNNLNRYTTDITIYDKNAESEKINIFFDKTDKNTWKVHLKSNDSDSEKSIDDSFDLKFNSDGKLISDTKFNIKPKNSKYENITLNLNGTVEDSETNNSWSKSTQNGYLKGSLQTFNILPNGEILGTYSNNQMHSIGQVLLSTFTRPEKLEPESGNLWSATVESGTENLGEAGDSGFGLMSSKTLEASNVDLNKELINMIIAQRNYQSNAQSFKTEDKMINTLINLR